MKSKCWRLHIYVLNYKILIKTVLIRSRIYIIKIHYSFEFSLKMIRGNSLSLMYSCLRKNIQTLMKYKDFDVKILKKIIDMLNGCTMTWHHYVKYLLKKLFPHGRKERLKMFSVSIDFCHEYKEWEDDLIFNRYIIQPYWTFTLYIKTIFLQNQN